MVARVTVAEIDTSWREPPAPALAVSEEP